MELYWAHFHPHDEYHCSPIMTRPKGGTKRRVIVDLSYGDEAVNAATIRNSYEGIDFQLQLPTLDHVLNQLLHLKAPLLVKADISRAFRNVPIDPRDAIKCGIAFDGKYCVDKFLIFGAMNGTMIFQRISDAIRYILAQENMPVWNYIDNIFAAWEEQGSGDKFKDMCKLIHDLGLLLNDKKVELPSSRMTIMGIQVDIPSKSISIPDEKMTEIVQACEEAYARATLSKRSLQSLLGKLLYISKVIKPARGFLNRMLKCLREMNSSTVSVIGELQRNLMWFRKFVCSFNGTTTFANWVGSYNN